LKGFKDELTPLSQDLSSCQLCLCSCQSVLFGSFRRLVVCCTDSHSGQGATVKALGHGSSHICMLPHPLSMPIPYLLTLVIQQCGALVVFTYSVCLVVVSLCSHGCSLQARCASPVVPCLN
jgi:hypothetical protein